MHPEPQIAFEARFGGIVCCEAYGQSEAVPITMISPTDPGRDRAGLGRASVLYDLRIVDEHDDELPPGKTGQIVVRPKGAHSMFSGYWRNPAATAASWRNLWHHTGDLGWLDDNGRLHFVDRAKDAIRRRGENISCFQVEQAIGLHPAVAQVAACAVPSALGEDDIKVSIVRRPPHEEDEAGPRPAPLPVLPRAPAVLRDPAVRRVPRVLSAHRDGPCPQGRAAFRRNPRGPVRPRGARTDRVSRGTARVRWSGPS